MVNKNAYYNILFYLFLPPKTLLKPASVLTVRIIMSPLPHTRTADVLFYSIFFSQRLPNPPTQILPIDIDFSWWGEPALLLLLACLVCVWCSTVCIVFELAGCKSVDSKQWLLVAAAEYSVRHCPLSGDGCWHRRRPLRDIWPYVTTVVFIYKNVNWTGDGKLQWGPNFKSFALLLFVVVVSSSSPLYLNRQFRDLCKRIITLSYRI